MILTDNELFAKKAKYLTTQAKDDPIKYVHDEIGYNYRLTNIQALGCPNGKASILFKKRKNIFIIYIANSLIKTKELKYQVSQLMQKIIIG